MLFGIYLRVTLVLISVSLAIQLNIRELQLEILKTNDSFGNKVKFGLLIRYITARRLGAHLGLISLSV